LHIYGVAEKRACCCERELRLGKIESVQGLILPDKPVSFDSSFDRLDPLRVDG